jgi:diguanylate cyclase (GGDEF)-like protein/PAS domain S-box-containing protein
MVALFREIFRKDIPKVGGSNAIRILLLASFFLMVMSVALPHRLFLPVLWAVAVPSLCTLIVLTVRIFYFTGSAAALWYGSSWLVTFLGAATEVAFASGLAWSRPLYLNSMSGAVFSAALAGIAIAERIRTERAGRTAARRKAIAILDRFKSNYNAMPIGLFSIDGSGQLTLCNPSFRCLFGLNDKNEHDLGIYIDELIGTGAAEKLSRSARESPGQDIEFLVRQPNGTDRWFLARASIHDKMIEGAIQDISTRKLAETQLLHLVDHDHLTGVLNRRGIERQLDAAIESARHGEECGLAYIDLDRFRLINDLHGHNTGDAILREAALRLRATLQGEDCLGRLADAFVVILRRRTSSSVDTLAEEFRQAISGTPFEILGKGVSISASIGLISLGNQSTLGDALLAADRACLEAKSRGRNCVARLGERDNALRQHLEELRVVADLQQRIPTERYFLEFQPIVALHVGATSLNYEVLIRMRGEGNDVIPPGRFIGAAERNGLMSQIDRWVLHNTLLWLDANPAHRNGLGFATVNISGASLNDSRFVNDAFSMIAEHPLAMSKLCFEITEGVALQDLGSTRRFVDRIRMYGSKLALDDFGAGYTSFNYLKEIPADFIKIDGSFIKDINRDAANFAITRTIVDLTHELGMRSIAEWAETPDTIASLIELGVDFGQGFGLARPMAPEKLLCASSGTELVADEKVLALLRQRSSSKPTAGAALAAAQR